MSGDASTSPGQSAPSHHRNCRRPPPKLSLHRTGDGRALDGHGGAVRGVLALADGRALTWSDDRTLQLWDLETGDGRALKGHAGRSSARWRCPTAVPSPGRTIGSCDCGIWKPATVVPSRGAQARSWGRWRCPTAASSPGRTIGSCDCGTRRPVPISPLEGHGGPLVGALALPDCRILSWSYDRTLRLWDLETGAGRALEGHAGPVRGALALPRGRVLSWSDDRSLRLWNLETGDDHVLSWPRSHRPWLFVGSRRPPRTRRA